MSEPSTRPIDFPRVEGRAPSASWLDARADEVRPLEFRSRSSGQLDTTPSIAPPASGADAHPAPTPPPVTQEVESEVRSALQLEREELERAKRELAEEREAFDLDREEYAQAVRDLVSAAERAYGDAEANLLELSVAIADAIVEVEIERRPEHLRRLAQKALELLGETEQTAVFVSQRSYEALEKLGGAPELTVRGRTIALTIDESMAGWGCVVADGPSRVNAEVRQRLSAVREELIDTYRTEEASTLPSQEDP